MFEVRLEDLLARIADGRLTSISGELKAYRAAHPEHARDLERALEAAARRRAPASAPIDPPSAPEDLDEGPTPTPRGPSADPELRSRLWSEMVDAAPPEDATESLVLLERFRRDEAGAGDQLVLRYQDKLQRYVRVLLGAHLRRQLDSGDVLQDVLLDALPRLKDFEYRGKGSVLRYLKAAARHRIQSLGRNAGPSLDEGDAARDPFWLGLEQATEPAPGEELARRELAAILDAAASRLHRDE
jgi:DNA-directed RNA polymerase specialized sigma24 family protein